MSLMSPPLSARAREDQFVGDLATLFRRYRVRTGTPDCLRALAPQLQANTSLRSDLFALCNAISRMSESDLAAEELLPLVAKAVGGSRTPAELPSDFRDVFTSGFREWQARLENLPEFSFEAPEEDEAWRKANKFAAAASMKTRQTTPAPGADSERDGIAPETPIGDLTISELRTYLDEIEQRVGRLQPYLDTLRGASVPEPLNAAQGPPVTPPATIPPSEPRRADGAALASSSASPLPEVMHPDPAAPAALDPVELAVLTSPPEGVAVSTDSDDRQEPLALGTAAEVQTHAEPLDRLPLRTDAGAAPPEPYMFRSLAEPQPSSSRALLWVAAALALLAPAAYYGRRYVETPPLPSQIAPPPAPALSPADPPAATSEPAAQPVATKPAALSPAPNLPARRHVSSTHLQPAEVRMAAEAARAESSR